MTNVPARVLTAILVVAGALTLVPAVSAGPRHGQLGIFIHYGPSSLLNEPDEAAWIAGIQSPAYLAAVSSFRSNPAAVSQWVELAQRAGATYIVFAAKHHDGYTLWNSRVPVDRSAGANRVQWGASPDEDIVAALAQACHAAGIKLYLYYSLIDWYEHAYRAGDDAAHLAMERAQLSELLTKYGPIDGVWLDGVWSPTHQVAFWHLDQIEQEIHSLQPAAAIGVNRFETTTIGSDESFAISEKSIPRTQQAWPIQVVFPIGRLWFYSDQDRPKAPTRLRALIRRTIGRGFDLLLDVPPRSDGSIDPADAVALLAALGSQSRTIPVPR